MEPVSQDVAIQAGLYRRSFRKSHNLGIADAVIAATAVLRQARLVSLNVKHFPMLTDVVRPYHKV